METKLIYEFGGYRLVAAERQLLRAGAVIPLTPKAFDVLVALVKDAGHLLTKDELMRQVWPDTFVEESTLAQNIATLRKVLGESAAAASFIETVPKRGYRFIAPVQVSGEEVPEVVAEEHVVTRVSVEEEVAVARRAVPGWVWIVGAVAILMAAGGAWLALRPKPAQPIRSLAVLPFVNMSAKADQEYFSDGLTEEIINALAPVPGLQVVARTSAFQFKGKNVDIRTIGKSLGADAVLEGSVRIDGNRLRVTAQLNSTVDGYHYWSRTWDRDVKDLFAVQQEIASAIAGSWSGKSVPLRAARPITVSMEAYNLYLQGRYQRNKVLGEALQKAIGYYREAIQKDPNFAAAYAALADCYVDLGYAGISPAAEVFPLAEAATARALALDSGLADAHAMLGMLHLIYHWDWSGAERELKRATELDPGYGQGHHYYAHYLAAMSRFDEAVVAFRRAIEMDRLNMAILSHPGWHYGMTGDYAQAVRECEKGLEVDPNHGPTLFYLRVALTGKGDFDGAVRISEKFGELTPQAAAALILAIRTKGPSAYWQWRRDRALAVTGPLVDSPGLARSYARLGQVDRALDWLERGYRDRHPWMVYLQIEPAYQSLRAHPRFQGLVAKMAFPPLSRPAPEASKK